MAGYFVHVASYVDDNVFIGNGTEIWHFSHVQEGANIGENCSIGHSVNIGKMYELDMIAQYRAMCQFMKE